MEFFYWIFADDAHFRAYVIIFNEIKILGGLCQTPLKGQDGLSYH